MYVIPESLSQFASYHRELDSHEAIIAWFELQLQMDDHVDILGGVDLADLERARSAWANADDRRTYESERDKRLALAVALRTRMTVPQLAAWFSADEHAIACHAVAPKNADAWLAFAVFMEGATEVRFNTEIAQSIGVTAGAISSWIDARPHWKAKKIDRGAASRRMLELFNANPEITTTQMSKALKMEGIHAARSTVGTNVQRWRAARNRAQGKVGKFPHVKTPGPYVDRIKELLHEPIGPVAIYHRLIDEGYDCSRTQTQVWVKRLRSETGC
jgi:hypothetical protein